MKGIKLSKNEVRITAVKEIDAKNDIVGGYLVPFGSPEEKDLQGEYFTPSTDLKLNWADKRPLLYQHAKDDGIGVSAIGTFIKYAKDELGLWAEAQLDKSHRYYEVLKDLIKQGILHFSSGAYPNGVRTSKDGEILIWPLFEGSLTPNPAESRKTNVSLVKSAYKSMNLEMPDFEKLLEVEHSGIKAADIFVDGFMNTINEKIADGVKNMAVKNEEEQAEDQEGQEEETERKEVDEIDEGKEVREEVEETAEAEEDSTEEVPNTDTESKSKKENVFTMKEQLHGIITALANAKEIELTSKEADELGGRVYTKLKSLIGDVELEKSHLKMAFGMKEFNQEILVMLEAYQKVEDQPAEDLDSEDLAANILNSVKDDEVKKGSGGRSKHGLADAPAYIPDRKLKGQFANLSPEDVAFFDDISRQWAKKSDDFHYERPTFVLDQLADTSDDFLKDHYDFLANPTGDGEVGNGTPVAVQAIEAIKSVGGTKFMTTEGSATGLLVNHVPEAGEGGHWIPTLWRSSIWRQITYKTNIASRFRSFNLPSIPYRIPLDFDPPIVRRHHIGEVQRFGTGAHDAQYRGIHPAIDTKTSYLEMDVDKMGASVNISRELIEDSMIAQIPENRMKLQMAMARAFDWTLMNADSADTTTNYANYGTAPDDDNIALMFDGLVKTAASYPGEGLNGIDLSGGAVSLSDLRANQEKMEEVWMAQANQMFYIVTPRVYMQLRNIKEYVEAEIQTGNVRGQVGSLDMIPYIVSYEFGQGNTVGAIVANANGVPDAAENTRGRMLLVRPDHFLIGYRRKVRMFMRDLPESDMIQMNTNLRYGFYARDKDLEASLKQKAVSMIYNIAC